MIVSYVISDFLINVFIIGGRSAKISIISTKFQSKSRGYLALFTGIILGSTLSAVSSDGVLNFVKTNFGESYMFWGGIVACLAVFIDLELRVYKS
jgi:hypothetical protein